MSKMEVDFDGYKCQGCGDYFCLPPNYFGWFCKKCVLIPSEQPISYTVETIVFFDELGLKERIIHYD